MRFWQAYVCAQMAAGAVWADHFDPLWARLLAEGCSVAFGAALWLLFKFAFGSPHPLPRSN